MTILDDLQRYPVTAILLIGSGASFLAQATGRSVGHLLLVQGLETTEPWRFLTCVFVHGGILHLLFNAFWVWELGRAIERRIGTLWMLALTVFAALVAGGLAIAFSGSPIGLSGVVYAYAFFAFSRGRHDPRFAEVMDGMRIRFFVIWFFMCILMTQAGIMRIANMAHLGGALMGFALGSRSRWLAPALLALTALALAFAQPYFATSNAGVSMLQQRAFEALDRGDQERAIELYERVFDAGVDDPGNWKNYGIALQDIGRIDEAYAAWYRAIDLNPEIFEPEFRARIQRRRAGSRALQR